MAAVKPVPWARLCRKPAVDGHVLLIHLPDQRLVALPEQPFDPVSPADVHQEGDQGPISRVRYRPSLVGSPVVRHLDGNGPVVVGAGGGAPGAIAFLHIESDPAVAPDPVIAAGLPAWAGEQVSAALHRQITGHTVDGDGIDGVLAPTGMVRGQLCVGDQWTVAHGGRLLSCKLVVILLPVGSPAGFGRLTLVGRAFKLEQDRVGGGPDRTGTQQHLRQGGVAFRQLLPQELQLRLQIADALLPAFGKGQQVLLPAPEGPLGKAVTRSVMDKVGVKSEIHLLGVFLVREPQLPLMGVLEIDGVQPAFGVEVSHQSGGSAVGKQLPLQESPDPFFIHGVTPLCFLSSFAPRSGRGFVRKYPSGSSSSAGQSWRCIR